MSTQTVQSSTHDTARLYARHALNMTESESRAYARGFSDRLEDQHWSTFGSFQWAYEVGHQDAIHVDEEI